MLDYIKAGPRQRTRIKEACAIAAYHDQTAIPVVEILMSDDAPQFKLLARHIALCWIHDGRHYKKLNPIVPLHKRLLDEFLKEYWIFYHQLKAYKKAPDKQQAHYYRMIDQPEDSAFSMDNILKPHRVRTMRRMMAQRTVLCLQDGSELNYTNLDKCRGLGELKANQTGAKTKGLSSHSSFAIAPDGLPLGILKAQCIAPKARPADDKRKPSKIPIEEKKTFVWIEHHRDLVDIAASMPQTRLVHICDREADFFELLNEQRKKPSVDLLIRAKHDRNIKEDPFKLFSAVRQAPEQGRVSVPVPQQSARSKKSKQKSKAARPARLAELILRCITLQLPAPNYYPDKEPVKIQLIHALEENPPQGTKPVEWILLTTVKVDTEADIITCLRWYTLRWRIEDLHRVLKSGCKIDKLAHETAERLRRAIAINLVIAWRIMLMTLLGRETPELEAEILFSDVELRTMRAYAKKNN